MSYADFCALCPDEFDEVCKSWQDMRASETRDGWERTRTLATISIQPHVKNKITAQKLLPLPWDNKKPLRPKTKPGTPKMSPAEQRKRMMRLVEDLRDYT